MTRNISPSTTASDALRRVRRQQRLSQAQLAERAGVSRTVLARYESRQQQPTIAALERLVAACGYQLVWTIRHAADPADPGDRVGPAAAASDVRFPGPIGQRLTAHLDEVLTVLSSTGATDPRVYGGVADGTEGVQCRLVIGVTPPPGADPLSLIAASGHLALLVTADVTVVPHTRVAAYGYEDEGVPLVQAGESS